jgi:Ca2+-binding RTX toxin-like protein
MRRIRTQGIDYKQCEVRRLLASDLTMSVNNGVLTIDGSSQDDAVYVRYFADNILVRYGVRGIGLMQGQQFPASSINSVEFNGFDGDDLFVNNTDLSSLAYGGSGSDTLRGGSGVDSLYGGSGDDFMMGRDGVDDLHGDIGNDWLDGGNGDDEVLGWRGNDTLRGGDGNDYLSGFTGNDWMHGGSGDDTLKGHEDNDRLFGGIGNDEVFGWLGDDAIYGGPGNDELFGDVGNDYIAGNEGTDLIKGDEGEDRVFGGEGNDKLFGGDGWDLIVGGDGNDELWGGEQRDALHGNAGNDLVYGEGGADWLNGHEGDDILDGGTGHDRLTGGVGADLLGGSFNDDVYVGIDDSDVGNDPDSPFVSEDIDRSEQLLENSQWNEQKSFLERLHAVSEKYDDVGHGAYLPTINFEADPLENSFEPGDVVTDQWAWWGIEISTADANHSAVIERTSYQTNALIVSDPFDETRGGVLMLDFDRTVQLDQIGLLSDVGSESIVKAFAADGSLISEISFAGTGAQVLFEINGQNVQKLTVELAASGALTGIVFNASPE